MSQRIKVAVSGAGGRMGREVVKMVLEDAGLELVAAIDMGPVGADAGVLAGKPACGVLLANDLDAALAQAKPDVIVDFTTPHSVFNNVKTAIRHKVRPVVGTTGMSKEEVAELDKLCREQGIGGVIAPNFSVGAILMAKFAAQAAKYFPHVEIIETHGDQKLDAPSGTSVWTAEMISEVREELRQGNPEEKETIDGARGAMYNGFRIHSVRLPGVFAQQEVIFGGPGQSLKIRNDSYERSCYMPGVNLAVKKAVEYTGIVYGFENVME
jgi:4-hydroxy-tetrahydrodipicolinate reductase